jgi:hypothetical protein
MTPKKPTGAPDSGDRDAASAAVYAYFDEVVADAKAAMDKAALQLSGPGHPYGGRRPGRRQPLPPCGGGGQRAVVTVTGMSGQSARSCWSAVCSAGSMSRPQRSLSVIQSVT